MHRRLTIATRVIVPILFVIILLAFPFHVFLSDSAMERLLNEHRKEFQELVFLAQEERRTRLTSEPDYNISLDKHAKDLMFKLGVKRAKASGLWLEDPYAPDYMSRLSKEISNPDVSRFYAVEVEPVGGSYLSASAWRLVNKVYYFVPQAAEIENGWFMGPADFQGKKTRQYWINGSLDWYWFLLVAWPNDRNVPCVVKETNDPHWYVKFCRSK